MDGGELLMPVAFIFLAITLMFILLLVSFVLRDYPIGMLSSMGLLSIGVYIAIYNIEEINNLLTQTISIICIAVGFMVFIVGSIQKIEEGSTEE